MLRFARKPLGVILACASVAVLASGCGVSHYNRLVRKRAARLRGEVKFKGLYQPTKIPDTPLSIRIPMIFSDSYTAESPHPDDGAQIRPDRLAPPFLPLPGMKLTYENTATAPDGSKQPFYCYLAAVTSQAGQAERYAGELLTRLKQTFPNAPDAWEVVDAESPTGFAVHWQKIRTSGPQPFLVKKDGQVAVQSLDGLFELWMHDAGDHVVFVGWRTPSAINEPSTGELPSEGGTVLPPSDPKPDMDKWPQLTAGTLTKESDAE